MSLSLQYPSTTSDLHVSTVRDPPSEVTLTSIYSGIGHHLSGLNNITITQFQPKFWIGWRFAEANIVCIHYGLYVLTPHPCYSVKLLGPCSKTGRIQCHPANPKTITCEIPSNRPWPPQLPYRSKFTTLVSSRKDSILPGRWTICTFQYIAGYQISIMISI